MAGFFWFLVGAGTATIWGQHHRYQQQEWNGTTQHSGWQPFCERRRAYERSKAVTPPPNANETSNRPVNDEQEPPTYGYETRGFWGGKRDATPAAVVSPPIQEESPREQEFRMLSRQAGNAMTEISEATLDTLMTTILAAKNKLADRRVQREAEEKRQIDAFNGGRRQ